MENSAYCIAHAEYVPPPLVPDFSISVSPTFGMVAQGGSISATVSVSSIAGFAETVALSATGLPSGATAIFTPPSGTPSFTSTLTISTAAITPAGTYSITIAGTGGGMTRTCTYTLAIAEYVPPPKPFPLEAVILGIGIGIIAIIVVLGLLFRRRRRRRSRSQERK